MKFILMISLYMCLSACTGIPILAALPAELVEYSLVEKLDVNDEELKTSLSIDVQSHPISHNLVVKNNGELWSIYDGGGFKWDRRAYLGRESDILFGRVAFIDDVKMSVTTINSHIVLKNDGTVWSWGGGDIKSGGVVYESTLGYHSDEVTLKAQRIKGLPLITYIANVGGFIMATARDGSVWSWGFSYQNYVTRFERLRDGPKAVRIKGLKYVGRNYWSNFSEARSENSIFPVKIPELKNIAKAYGGHYLSKDGGVYTTVRNTANFRRFDGYLSEYIAKVSLPSLAVDISNGYALLDNGHVWYLGGSPSKKLKCGISSEYCDNFRASRVLGLSKVIKLGDSIALTKDGEVGIWGSLYYKSGYLSVSNTSAKPVKISLKADNIKYFSRDSVVSDDGDVWFRWNNGLFDRVIGLPSIKGDVYVNPSTRFEFISRSLTFHKLDDSISVND